MTAGIALVLSEVDGTLVTGEKTLTDATRAAVAALRQAGIRFAITSGRPPRGLRMLTGPLGIDTPVAGFNGGVLTAPDLATVIAAHDLPAAEVRATLALLDAHGLDIWVYTHTRWLLRDPTAARVAREAQAVGFAPEAVARFDADAIGPVAKIVGVRHRRQISASARRQRCRSKQDLRARSTPLIDSIIVERALTDDPVRMERCAVAAGMALGNAAATARSQPYYLDITHPSANKGAVVGMLAARYDIDPARIATIGDMPNDIAMFLRAGLSIAMGNADPSVKAHARHVTDSNDNDGFALAIRRHILGGIAS